MRRITHSNLVALLLFSLGCTLGLLGLLMLPRHLPALLGLERAGPLAEVLPPDPAPLPVSGSSLGSIDILLPPHIAQPAALGPADLEGLAITGGEASTSSSFYRVTLTEQGLGDLLRRWCVSGGVLGSACSDLSIDLQPGGLLVSREIGVGPWRARLGLLLLEDEGRLATAAVLVGQDLYAAPAEGLAARLVSRVQSDAQRIVEGLSIVAPLPGQAQVTDVSFHGDRLEILATVPEAVELGHDTGWGDVEAGVQTRQITVRTAAGSEDVVIVRLDPSAVTFSVRYEPGEPLSISSWSERIDPLLVVNGGYFTEEYETIYLLVASGRTCGTALGDFAGMFAAYADGRVSVQWLEQAPYSPDDDHVAVVQSFPVLVKPGGVVGFPRDADNGARSRRTAVAQDFEGDILVVVAPRTGLSLHELAVFLAEADLGIDVALNLDGGGSTGLYLSAGGGQVEIDSITLVPSVIVAERR